MGRTAGVDGVINIGGALSGVTAWTLDETGEVVDTTGMGDTIDEGERGLYGATITASGHRDATDLPDNALVIASIEGGSDCAFSFADGIETKTGDAVITSLVITATNDGTVDFSLAATVNGAVATA
ncbi:unnamed protein product [marine sediment metagenome]|uniref:Uncharacterized protein n=1 Tax=marine sediment metagenome TaxID=412755 RepID=X0W587_9ZZZZ